MKTKHTPGPWFPVQYCQYWQLQTGPMYGDMEILNEDECIDKAEANAKLAAASPDLLEALQEYLKAGHKEARRLASIKAKAAIKKATE